MRADQKFIILGDEEALYVALAAKLRSAVQAAVYADPEYVNDACSFALLQLLTHQPIRTSVFGWLRTTAIREVWRLTHLDRRDHRLTACRADGDENLEAAMRAREAITASGVSGR